MIRIIVMYMNRETEVFIAKSFQQGDMAMSLELEDGHLAIPVKNVKAYRVQKIEEGEATEPYDATTFEGTVENEGGTEQEEGTPEKEEA